MPIVYLSPSLQEFNPFINGGTEEEYMNLIADAMEPYLAASGITVIRNSPEMTLGEVIAASNNSGADFHLAIHSNASPESIAGQRQGPVIYYYSGSPMGKRMAEIIAENFKSIYPVPARIQTLPTVTLRELRRTRTPSALVEVAYHDNWEDADWIKENIMPIARELSRSLTEYFGIPFVEPPVF
ncbi:MAG: N-acetylmuramoyl-L-alanine amidase [Bacillota bacterium]|nr:N-acetylmuramoyl-L-alanine amidase [Bacillota bacterium]